MPPRRLRGPLYANGQAYWAEDKRRSPWGELRLGSHWIDPGTPWEPSPRRDGRVELVWVKGSGEVIARLPALQDEGVVEVIGHAGSFALAEAALRSRLDDASRNVGWAARRLAYVAGGPIGRQKAILARHIADIEDEERRRRDRLRATYRVVAVASLPPVSLSEIGVERAAKGACECRHCAGTWPEIAAAAVEAHHAGLDPLDLAAVATAAGLLTSARDQMWFASLFEDPIVAGRDRFTNGRHRTHALREAGVAECVVSVESDWSDD